MLQLKLVLSLIMVMFSFDVFSNENNLVSDSINTRQDIIYRAVPLMPRYPNGEAELMRYISKNINYSKLTSNQIGDVVIIQFVVTYEGKVGEVKIIRSGGVVFDEEAKRVIKSITSFIPGRKNGQNVNVWYTLPIRFTPEKY